MASGRTPRSGPSPVWGDRGFHRPAAGESHATCKLCGTTLAYPGSWYGTSHLKRHMGATSCLLRATTQQQQQQELVAPVVAAETFQPSGQQVHYYSTTTNAAELRAAPTAVAGSSSFQPAGQVRDAAATAFVAEFQLHGGVAEGYGAYAYSSSISNVGQPAASSSTSHQWIQPPPDDFADYEDTMIDPHLRGF